MREPLTLPAPGNIRSLPPILRPIRPPVRKRPG
nr:MAG TPA: hypothetical protein [Bacteriophage sp.]